MHITDTGHSRGQFTGAAHPHTGAPGGRAAYTFRASAVLQASTSAPVQPTPVVVHVR